MRKIEISHFVGSEKRNDRNFLRHANFGDDLFFLLLMAVYSVFHFRLRNANEENPTFGLGLSTTSRKGLSFK